MTDVNAQSGTDRIAEVAAQLPDVDIFINVQGDEPEISGAAIDQVMQLLVANPNASVATLSTPIRTRENLMDPACVKVVCQHDGSAMYFSRSLIPHPREWTDAALDRDPVVLAAYWNLRLSTRFFRSTFPVAGQSAGADRKIGAAPFFTGRAQNRRRDHSRVPTEGSTPGRITKHLRPDGSKKPPENPELG